MREALPPGGWLFLTVPALPWLWSSHDEAVGHRRRYTSALLRAAIEAAGLEVVQLGHFNSLLLPLAMVHLALRRRRGHHLEIPSRPVNALLHAAFAAERPVVVRGGFPLGVSLLAVARRPAGDAGAGGPA